MVLRFFFFFKPKTAYEIVSRDWSSDVCSSDLDFGFHKITGYNISHRLLSNDHITLMTVVTFFAASVNLWYIGLQYMELFFVWSRLIADVQCR